MWRGRRRPPGLRAVVGQRRGRQSGRGEQPGHLGHGGVEQHPLREPLARFLMLALYRSGRHADALAAYRDLSARLRELGLEPEEESRKLERQMLQRAPELAVVEPARDQHRRKAHESSSAVKTTAGDVRERFVEHRLVTLTGPGGVGKTSLAVEAARGAVDEHSDGAWLVELAPIRDPARVAEAVAEAVGLRSSEFEGRSATTLSFLQSHLRRRELAAGPRQLRAPHGCCR